jgi:hypothetical protein
MNGLERLAVLGIGFRHGEIGNAIAVKVTDRQRTLVDIPHQERCW